MEVRVVVVCVHVGETPADCSAPCQGSVKTQHGAHHVTQSSALSFTLSWADILQQFCLNLTKYTMGH